MVRTGSRIVERHSRSENFRLFSAFVHRTKLAVTVTSRPSIVRRWIRSVKHIYRRHLKRLVVGLGVQWPPDYAYGDDNPAATLQLCVGHRCLVFQLLHSEEEDDHPMLQDFLANADYSFVGLWNGRDAGKLSKSRHRLEVNPETLVDLRKHAVTTRGESLASKSVEEIAREYLGFDGSGLDKSINRSRWDVERLSHQQVWHACYDAFVSFEIGRKMKIWKIRPEGYLNDRSSEFYW